MKLDNNFGFFVTVDKKNRIILPSSIVERRRMLDGQELFAQKCDGKIYITFSEPEGGYVAVIYKKGHGINFPERAGFEFPRKKARILEYKNGIIILPVFRSHSKIK